MKTINKTIAILVILAGIGHILLAVLFDNPAMYGQMIMAGIIYIILSVLVWFNSNIARVLLSLMMLFAGISSIFDLEALGYPTHLMIGLLSVNILVVILTITYYHQRRKWMKKSTLI